MDGSLREMDPFGRAPNMSYAFDRNAKHIVKETLTLIYRVFQKNGRETKPL